MHLSSSLVSSFPKQSKHIIEKMGGALVTKKRAAGFTLLELMAVILIIGIIVSFASLSIGQNSSRIVQEEVERLHGLIQLAGEEAVLQGREIALEFDRDRYQFLELGGDGWQPIEEDKMFRKRPLPETVELELTLEGVETNFEDKQKLPRIFILSSGELTPFNLILSIDEGEKYSLQGEFNGKLILKRVENDEG